MENPLDSIGSKTQGLNEQAEDSKPQDQNELGADSKPQDLSEQVEENRPQHLNEQVEENKPQDLNEQIGENKPQDLSEQIEENKPQDLNEQIEENRSQDLHEQVEENRPQDLKDWVEEQMALGPPVEMVEQVPVDEEAFSSPRLSSSGTWKMTSRKMTMTYSKEEVLSSPTPEPILDDSTLLKQAEDSELQDLKERIEESMKTLMEIPGQHPQEVQEEKSFSLSNYRVSQKTSKKQKAEAPSIPSKPASLLSQSVPPKISPPRYIAPKPKPQTADKATQLRAIPIFPLRLPGLVKRPPQRTLASKPEIKPPTSDNGTQISPSFERLLKRPPPLIKKKKSEDKTSTSISSDKTISPSVPKERGRLYRSSVERTLQKKRIAIERGPQSWKKSTTIERVPRSQKKLTTIKRASQSQTKLTTIKRAPRSQTKLTTIERTPRSQTKLTRPQVIYNFYVNLCDCCKEMEPRDYHQSNWRECVSCSGLSRACTVFSTLKSGGIHVSDLLLTLHALGILVTQDEMHETLKLVSVNGGIVNFSEFLEAVNKTSPFAETDALQNALRAFRKIKKGMVAVRDLESVLANLGVSLSYENVQHILKCPRVSKNQKVDLSSFFTVARELEGPEEEEEEACPNERTVWERLPFQDVANLVSAKSRWRRKYGCFNEDICDPWSYSDEDIAVDKPQERVSWIPITVSPVYSAERENKDRDIVTKSQSGFINQRRSSMGFVQNADAKNEDSDIVEMIKSQADVANRGRSSTASIHNVEAENKKSDIMEMIKSQADVADQGRSSTASIHNIEAENKEGDIVEVTAS